MSADTKVYREAADKFATTESKMAKEKAGTKNKWVEQPERPDGLTGFSLVWFYLKRLNWLHVPLLIGVPLLGLYGATWVPLKLPTLVFAVLYYFCTGFGITAGYHRLWAHRAYKATWPVELGLALFGAGAFEGSIRWWGRDHRAHHRYSDTAKDPYSVEDGFLWAHIGWMLFKQEWKTIGRSDISDFKSNRIIMWQHKYYLPIAVTMAFLVPTLVCKYLFDDALGGFYYAGVIRLVFVHQATFFVNSLAHTLGEKTFDDRVSAVDSIITAFLTLGEGYHNFHHEFPSDFRNAIHFWQYDPTKWLIYGLSLVGLTYDLQMFPENEITKGRLQVVKERAEKELAQLDWGPNVDTLPVWTMDEVQERVRAGDELIVVEGFAHDVKKFAPRHPGGLAQIKNRLGEDVTEKFNGGVYDHSRAARNLMQGMRVARVPSAEDKKSK